MVYATTSKNIQSRLGYFIFRFVDTRQYDSIRRKEKYPQQITIFEKESFEWDIKHSRNQKMYCRLKNT